jgi:hypothetical protein
LVPQAISGAQSAQNRNQKHSKVLKAKSAGLRTPKPTLHENSLLGGICQKKECGVAMSRCPIEITYQGGIAGCLVARSGRKDGMIVWQIST